MLDPLSKDYGDWGATGSMLQGIGSLIGAAAVLIAAWVGRSTFEDWKRQKLEERKIAAVEQILTSAFKMKEAFLHIRSPSASSSEREAAFQNMESSGLIDESTPIEQRSRLLSPQTTIDRINTYRARWSEAELTPLATAVFGQSVADHVMAFRAQGSRVASVANRFSCHGKAP